jgi:Ca2+-binding RTX toxin-like protein
MATFKGTAGNDNLNGTNAGDIFRLHQGGDDTALGGQNDDRFLLRETFTSDDTLSGGHGLDRLVLNGDYGAGVIFNATTITGIDEISLKGGFDYNFTLNDGNVHAGESLHINGGRLGAGDILTVSGGAETDANYIIRGGAGNDVITGGAQDDEFFLRRGGNDQVFGGDGNDTFYMVGALDATDEISGNSSADNDVVNLNGKYDGAKALVFNATTMTFIETLRLSGGHNYDLTLHEATLASGESMWIDGNLLGASDVLTLDLSAETNGFYTVSGSAGDDVITGPSNGDSHIHLEGGGDDTFTGGPGNGNDIHMGAALTAADTITGGSAGFDSITLNGDYSGANALVFGATTMTNVSTIHLTGGHDYDLTSDDATVAFGGFLGVFGGSLTAGDTLIFDGSAETNAMFIFNDGNGDDVLRGGEAADTFNFIGSGADTVIIGSTGASSGPEYDTLTLWNFDADKLDLFMTVAAIASPVSGTINSGSFNSDMGSAINDNLPANNAILVTANGGNLNGSVFLVIEGGGSGGGYNSSTDVVLNVTGYSGTLDTSDFI